MCTIYYTWLTAPSASQCQPHTPPATKAIQICCEAHNRPPEPPTLPHRASQCVDSLLPSPSYFFLSRAIRGKRYICIGNFAFQARSDDLCRAAWLWLKIFPVGGYEISTSQGYISAELEEHGMRKGRNVWGGRFKNFVGGISAPLRPWTSCVLYFWNSI